MNGEDRSFKTKKSFGVSVLLKLTASTGAINLTKEGEEIMVKDKTLSEVTNEVNKTLEMFNIRLKIGK
jgi:hypothetical protein